MHCWQGILLVMLLLAGCVRTQPDRIFPPRPTGPEPDSCATLSNHEAKPHLTEIEQRKLDPRLWSILAAYRLRLEHTTEEQAEKDPCDQKRYGAKVITDAPEVLEENGILVSVYVNGSAYVDVTVAELDKLIQLEEVQVIRTPAPAHMLE